MGLLQLPFLTSRCNNNSLELNEAVNVLPYNIIFSPKEVTQSWGKEGTHSISPLFIVNRKKILVYER